MKQQHKIYIAIWLLLLLILGWVFFYTLQNKVNLPTVVEVTQTWSEDIVDNKVIVSDEDKARIIKNTLEKKPWVEWLADLHNRFSHEIFSFIDCIDFTWEAQQYCNEQQAYMNEISKQIYWSDVVEKWTDYAQKFNCIELTFEADKGLCRQFQLITWSSVVKKWYEYAIEFDCDQIETDEGPQLCKDFQNTK